MSLVVAIYIYILELQNQLRGSTFPRSWFRSRFWTLQNLSTESPYILYIYILASHSSHFTGCCDCACAFELILASAHKTGLRDDKSQRRRMPLRSMWLRHSFAIFIMNYGYASINSNYPLIWQAQTAYLQFFIKQYSHPHRWCNFFSFCGLLTNACDLPVV